MNQQNKKIQKKLWLAILITFVFASQAFLSISKNVNNEFANHSKLRIALNKDTFLESEPIWLEVNAFLDESQKLDRKPILEPSNDLKLTLRNSKGENMKYVGGISDFILEEGKKYPDTLFFYDNLLLYYGLPERFPHSNMLMQFYLPEDTYELSASLELWKDHKLDTVISNTVSFSVSKPTGNEKLAYEKWLELENLKIRNEALNAIRGTIEEFMVIFPNSVYQDKVENALLSTSWLSRISIDSAKTYLINHIASNPNDHFNMYYLRSLVGRYEDNKNDLINILRDFKTRYKETLLSKFLKYIMQEIK